MNQELMQKYAEFAVVMGANPQKGQTLIINAGVESAFFVRACVKAAYEKTEVREVVVRYNDEQLDRLNMQYVATEVLEDIKPYVVRSQLDYLESEGSACYLHILSEDPEIFKGLDTEKIARVHKAMAIAKKPVRAYTMTDKVQWSIVAIPSPAWAKTMYPELDEAAAVERQWQDIFDVCRVTGGDPVGAWKEHLARMSGFRDRMNELHLTSIHLYGENGTDLDVGLADTNVWEGGNGASQSGVPFIANIPTEEVFTAPHRLRTNGVVYGTKPYVYNGNVIKGLRVTFKDGVVVDYDADENKEVLAQLLDTDEGARHIGEMALVPASSPINKKNVLFYNTLFDENAACHIAFGKGYPGTVKNGAAMSDDELLVLGVNNSLVHEDIMVGSADMKITGKTADGKEVLIFEHGEWVL